MSRRFPDRPWRALLLAALLLPALAAARAQPSEQSLCVEDVDCVPGQTCHLGVCMEAQGIGQICDAVTSGVVCDEGLVCAPDPAEPVLFRCLPDRPFDHEDAALCRRYYSSATHEDDRTYFGDSEAATFAIVVRGEAGAVTTAEYGAVYGRTGEYGCYRTLCTGLMAGAEVGVAHSTSELFAFSEAGFEAPTEVAVGEGGLVELPGFPLGLGFSVAQRYSTAIPPALEGVSYALGLEPGVESPWPLGAYACTTELTLAVAPPIAEAGSDQTVECTDPSGALVTLDGSGSYDPDGGSIESWAWSGSFGTTEGPTPEVAIALGSEEITLVVVDDEGVESAPDVTLVTVADTAAPELSVVASPDVLWPPNGKLVEVELRPTVRDACDPEPSCAIVEVSSDESGRGASDWRWLGDLRVGLRARRDGHGDGRRYLVAVACEDAQGNRTTATTQVRVPHDRQPEATPSSRSSSESLRGKEGSVQAARVEIAITTLGGIESPEDERPPTFRARATTSSCGLGFEVAPLMVYLCVRRRRRRDGSVQTRTPSG